MTPSYDWQVTAHTRTRTPPGIEPPEGIARREVTIETAVTLPAADAVDAARRARTFLHDDAEVVEVKRAGGYWP